MQVIHILVAQQPLHLVTLTLRKCALFLPYLHSLSVHFQKTDRISESIDNILEISTYTLRVSIEDFKDRSRIREGGEGTR